MATIIFDHRIGLPVGELAKQLKQVLPAVSWRVGDGPQEGIDPLERPTSIIGRTSTGDMILLGITLHDRPLPLSAGAPPHQLHLELAGPSVDIAEIADRILLAVGSVILSSAGRGMLQIVAAGRWYSAAVLELGLAELVRERSFGQFSASDFFATRGEVGGVAAAAGDAPPIPAGRPRSAGDDLIIESDLKHSFAKILSDIAGPEFATQMGYQAPPSYAEEEPRADRLPTFVIALERPLEFDWAPLMDLGSLDADGGWRVEPGEHGTGTLHGRGSTVTITADPAPIPDYILANARARSFWYTDQAALARRTSSLVVTAAIDTRAAPFEDVRETAKVVTLLLGLLTRAPGALALLNNGVHTLLAPDMVQSQVGHLHKNQIPLMLWTWTAPDSMVRDNVSLTSGGVLPFLGYEVEVWNAPGDPNWVGEKMGEILNYLLHVGPIVGAGETFGENVGHRSIRAFFGESRAQRYEKGVPAMYLEFDNPGGIEVPKADPLPGAAPEDRQVADGPPMNEVLCLIARTRVSSYPGNIVIEQLERNFPEFRWSTRPDDPTRPTAHRIYGEGDGRQVRGLVTAHSLSIARSLNPPPHRFLIDVAVGTGGDMALARRVGLVLACCNVIQVDPGAHFQLGIGGNWLTHDDALTGVSVPCHTKDIGDFDLHFGIPADRFAGVNPYLPDAAPPMPDLFADAYVRLSVARPQGKAGAGLKQRFDNVQQSSQSPDAEPPAEPRRGVFGRPLFGRKRG